MRNTLSQLDERIILAAVFILFFFPFVLVLILPQSLDQTMDKSSYIVFHNVAEFFSIMVSLCVFSVGWFTYDQSKDQRALFLGTAFLTIGLIDFMHTLSNVGMPAFITPNSMNKSTQFWISARLLGATTFLASAFINDEQERRWIGKKTAISAAIALTASIFIAVTFLPEHLPATAEAGKGITVLKRYLEFLVIILLACSFAIYWKRLKRTGDRNLLYFLAAFIICIFSGAVFASYVHGFNTLNVLGHLYKVVAFYLIYKGIFVSAVQKPYLHLSEANEKLLRLNRLYTVLSETNKVIVRAADREALFGEICRVVVERGGFRMAWVGVVDEVTGRVEAVAWSGHNEGYLDGLTVVAGLDNSEEAVTSAAVTEGVLQVCHDNTFGVPGGNGRAKERRGYRSCTAVPFNLNGRTIGALTIYASEKNFFRPKLMDLLTQLGSDISFALERFESEALRLEAERALKEETLERLRVMETLHEKNQLLIEQSRLAAMGEMINNIAHQWRQPLNVVGLIVQDLQMTFNRGELTRELFERKFSSLMDVLQHMSETIEHFRNFFKPDKTKESFLVSSVISRTFALVEASFRNLHIRLDLDIANDAEIHGYPNEYSQVLLNILMNSRDAFSERAQQLDRRVCVSVFSEEGGSVVTIADNAGGIPEGIIHKVFDPYFTTKGPDRGTGLGLYMSKSIIDKSMNGNLTVCNTVDGALFRIDIPHVGQEQAVCAA